MSDKIVYTGDGDKTPIDGAGYYDGEGYSASIIMGGEFGCVNHSDLSDHNKKG